MKKIYYQTVVNPTRGQHREFFNDDEKEKAIARTQEWKKAKYDVRLYKIVVDCEENTIDFYEIVVRG